MALNKSILFRLNTYFRNKLGLREYRKGWLKGDCPACSKRDKYGVNLSQNRTNCFVCGYSKRPFDVMLEFENLSNKTEGVKFLIEFKESEFVIENDYKRPEQKTITLPEGYKLLSIGDSIWGKSARNYLKKRGFNIDKLSLEGVGYCTTGPRQGYIILPFYTAGKLTYYHARKFIGNGPKFNNPTIDEIGVGKSLVIYNHDALFMYKTVYVVESVLNAKTLGDKAVAIGGKSISPWQLNEFIKSKVENFILILDPDAIKESLEQALKLAFHKKVKVVLLPPEKDVNDIGKELTLVKVFKTRKQGYNDLLKMKKYYEKPEYTHN